MLPNIIWFTIFHLVPSLLLLFFAHRMVEANARAYPRLYGPVGRRIALGVLYVMSILWVVIGLRWL